MPNCWRAINGCLSSVKGYGVHGTLAPLYRISKKNMGGGSPAFLLVAVLKDGSQVKLYGPESESRVLQYLEQQIERRLGIEDRRMENEAPKPGKMHIVTESR